MTLSPNEASPAKGVDIKSFHHKKKNFFDWNVSAR